MGWDFNSAIDLLCSDSESIACHLLPERKRLSTTLLNRTGGVCLGSFSRLYDELNLPQSVEVTSPQLALEACISDHASHEAPLLQKRKSFATNTNTSMTILPDQSSLKNTSPAQKKSAKKQEYMANRQSQENKDEKIVITKDVKSKQEHKEVFSQVVHAHQASRREAPNRARSNIGTKIRAASPVTRTTLAPQDLVRPTLQPCLPIIPHRPPQISESKPIKLQPTSLGHEAPSRLDAKHLQSKLAGGHQNLVPAPVTQILTFPHQSGDHGLIPRTVHVPATPIPHIPRQTAEGGPTKVTPVPPLPVVLAAPSCFAPAPQGLATQVTIRPQIERHFHLFNKLLQTFPNDRKWLVAPMQLLNESTMRSGIHIFVDMSNIMYGFKDALHRFGYSSYDISFDSLALLMQRRRPVAKRVFAGSHREAKPAPQVAKLVETSKAVGYESNVIEQVLIVREESEKKKFFNHVKKVGWHKAQQIRSGSGSDSETSGHSVPKVPAAPKWVEQGVDELLHLKMCQSLLDVSEPSTMVLATGDGAAAEMSDGFLAQVERALKRGWTVELMSWRQQINAGYKKHKFRKKWGDQFRIIVLDDFLEDVIDTQ